ncbi:MAG: DUF4397 domain-containing protein [Vicinamibacteria bacterium]
MLKKLPLLFFLIASVSCDDDPPTTPGNTTTTTTTAPATSGGALLRGAQLNEDARTVDLVVNGQEVATNIPYAGVGPYAELDPGDYRVQFFPAGDRSSALIETRVTLSSGQALTVALLGVTFDTFVLTDDRTTRADRARVRFMNAVPDYPAPFDLAIENGPGLFSNVGYLQATGYDELIPGGYNLVLRRAASTEEVATLAGQNLSTGSNYTLFAVGTLRRNDIELFVARDGN